MMRTDPATGNITNVDTVPFNSYQEFVYYSTDLEAMYEMMIAKMLESFSEFLKNGSGWTLKKIVRLDINVGKNKPVKGSSYAPLPNALRNKGALINMKNKKDNQCFKWAITRCLNPTNDDPQRIKEELRKQGGELNWSGGVEFPTPCSERMYKKFEKNNDASLLVFGHETIVEETRIIPLYVPTERREKVVRLFFFKSGKNSHYCVIKSMSRLIPKQTSAHHGEKYVCDYCLNYVGSQKVLDKHTESCSKREAVNTVLPKPGENILKFKNIQNCVECPIKIYADTESFLTTIDETRGETKLYQRHVMSTFCLYVVSRVKEFLWIPLRT